MINQIKKDLQMNHGYEKEINQATYIGKVGIPSCEEARTTGWPGRPLPELCVGHGRFDPDRRRPVVEYVRGARTVSFFLSRPVSNRFLFPPNFFSFFQDRRTLRSNHRSLRSYLHTNYLWRARGISERNVHSRINRQKLN
jgi:hypothetical protein